MEEDVNRGDFKQHRRYYPMLVTESGEDKKMPMGEHRTVWEKFDVLTPEIQDILTAKELPEALFVFQQKNALGDGTVTLLALSVRKFFFGDWSQQVLEEKVASMILHDGKSDDATKSLVRQFQEEVLSVRPKSKATDNAGTGSTTEKLPLLQALGKYPRLGEQLVTDGRLMLKGRPEPLRGSLSNWLKVYRDELGVGYHDPVLRAKFLFNSANTKGVSSEERERINVLLRSVEENTPIEVDTRKFEIIFPSFRTTEKRPAPKMADAPSPWATPPTPSPAGRQATPPVREVAPAAAPKRQGFSGFSANPVDRKMAERQPGFQPARPAQAPPNLPTGPEEAGGAPATMGSFSFSSKHAFQAEKKEKAVQSAQPNPLVIHPSPRPPRPRTDLPKNVVDLRGE